MKVESLFSEVSITPARAGPVERQGSKDTREQGSSTPASLHKEHPASPLSGQGREEIREEKAVEPVVNGLQVRLQFIQDKDTGLSVIKVYDHKSGRLIRQIPAEEVLAFLRQIEADKGVLVSRRL